MRQDGRSGVRTLGLFGGERCFSRRTPASGTAIGCRLTYFGLVHEEALEVGHQVLDRCIVQRGRDGPHVCEKICSSHLEHVVSEPAQCTQSLLKSHATNISHYFIPIFTFALGEAELAQKVNHVRKACALAPQSNSLAFTISLKIDLQEIHHVLRKQHMSEMVGGIMVLIATSYFKQNRMVTL